MAHFEDRIQIGATKMPMKLGQISQINLQIAVNLVLMSV